MKPKKKVIFEAPDGTSSVMGAHGGGFDVYFRKDDSLASSHIPAVVPAEAYEAMAAASAPSLPKKKPAKKKKPVEPVADTEPPPASE